MLKPGQVGCLGSDLREKALSEIYPIALATELALYLSGTNVAIPSYRRGEKRRSSRVTLAVPVRVDGENVSGEKFIVSTVTYALSQYGCLLQLDEEVIVDQTLVLMNEHTRQSAQGRIVSTRRHRNGHKYVGVEFISPCENFWRLTFVKPGARSLKRTYGASDA